MELNEETVLAAVNDLHARTGKRVFTLIDIAEAIEGQRVTAPPGMRVSGDAHDKPLPELTPPITARARTINSILLRLGEEGKLTVMQTAMVVFGQE